MSSIGPQLNIFSQAKLGQSSSTLSKGKEIFSGSDKKDGFLGKLDRQNDQMSKTNKFREQGEDSKLNKDKEFKSSSHQPAENKSNENKIDNQRQRYGDKFENREAKASRRDAEDRKPLDRESSKEKEVTARAESAEETSIGTKTINKNSNREIGQVIGPQKSQMTKDIEAGKEIIVAGDELENELISGGLKAEETATNLDPLTRRIAMQTFLKKMKEDLDIPPDQLVVAFSNLSVEDLYKAPQESLEPLLDNLSLVGEERQTARGHFYNLLKQTASTSLADYLKDNGENLSIQLISKRELQTNQLRHNLDSMSNQFFVNPRNDVQSQNPNIVQMNELGQKSDSKQPEMFTAAGLMEMKEGESLLEAEEASASAGIRVKNNGQFLANNENDFDVALSPKSIDIENLSLDTDEAESQLLGDLDLFDALDTDGSVEASDLGPGAGNTIKNEAANIKLANANGIQGAFAAVSLSTDSSELGSSGEEGLDQNPNFVQVQVQGQEKSQGTNEFLVGTKPTVNNTQESANVKEVINQAHFMIRKGGGEMRVSLAPEGLGEVLMKVNVKDGAVNVEMIADNNDAKKIIERGLSELKATLASQKLNVEQIKIETSNDILNNLNHKQGEAERQFAHQFMNEFSRNNQSWRNGFFGLTGARAYESQTLDEAQNPLLGISSRPKNSQRRLDLVA